MPNILAESQTDQAALTDESGNRGSRLTNRCNFEQLFQLSLFQEILQSRLLGNGNPSIEISLGNPSISVIRGNLSFCNFRDVWMNITLSLWATNYRVYETS